jgi:ligand-binding sensor domain-containing protein
MSKELLSVLMLLLLFILTALGQTKIHRAYSSDDGMIIGEITDLLIDSKGFLWITTLEGVSRWDGTTFQNFMPENGLAGSQVLDVEEGPDSSIYLATFGYGITVIKDNKIDTLNTDDGLITNFISKVYFNKAGKMFLGAGGELLSKENGKFFNISRKLKIPMAGIRDIWENENGDIFLATFNGLIKINEESFKIYTTKDGLNNNYVTGLAIGESSVIFLSTDAGCNIMEKEIISPLYYKEKIITASMESVLKGNDNKFYFASNVGLFVSAMNEVNLINEQNGLIKNRTAGIVQDVRGTVYIGTKDYGLNIYRPGILENYTNAHGLEQTNITSILQNNNKELLLGTTSGLVIFKPEENKFSNVPGEILNNNVNAMKYAENGEIYIATNSGLNLFRNGNLYNTKLIKGNPFDKTYALEFLDNGKLLIGKMDGLFIKENTTIEKATKNSTTVNKYIYALLQRKDGSIVVGTHGNGAVIYKNSNFDENDVILKRGIINSIFESSRGSLWIGTASEGAIEYNGKISKSYNVLNGLNSNNIRGITEDRLGKIYFSTPKGINIIDNLKAGVLVRTITKQDGLVSNDCNKNAIICDDEGIIWIGTSAGITKYDPQKDIVPIQAAQVYIKGLEVFNKQVDYQKFLREPVFSHNENYLKFLFSAIELVSPHKIKYRYRLSNVDKEWVTGSSPSVQYTSLDDDNYTFEVKAINEWGQQSEAVVINFEILPAWWETFWFRIAGVLFISLIIWLIVRLRLNYLIKLERLRTKIASDLHDEVGSLLTQISMSVDLLSYSSTPRMIKEKSGFIRSKCNEVIGIMSDVVWSIDARKDKMQSLVDRIQHFSSTFLAQKEIELEFVTNIKDYNKDLKIDFRQNILMIVKEAINNAVKHSECTKIIVKMSSDNNIFEMLITDNGKGMGSDFPDQGSGIKNIKMRAESINAELLFLNDNGLTIKLRKNNY